MINLYVASKFSHGAKWRHFFNDWPGVSICARWITHYSGVVPDEQQFCKMGWQHDAEDVAASDCLLVYAEPGEHLRGALVEVGMALATGTPVIAVGDHPDYGTWRFHPLVYQVDDLEAARLLVELLQLEPTLQRSCPTSTTGCRS